MSQSLTSNYSFEKENVFEELVFRDLDAMFPNQAFVAAEDICRFLGCDIAVVYNWNKRSDPRRRPPTMTIGKELRFQKRLFAKWLADEQASGRS